MSVQQRSEAIEKARGCPRCTYWGHQKPNCKMKANSCGATLPSGSCSADHSKLLHGTRNVYCAALGAKSKLSISSNNSQFDFVNENEETVFFLQDIPVKKSSSKARVMWDKGSNRVLIREEYARKNKLISKEVSYMIHVVGQDQPKEVNSRIYLVDLLDMYGNIRTVWGYGMSSILRSAVPDLACVRHLFPHVPSEAFLSLPERDVDILIGLNMNELQPAGGLGDDKVGG